MTCKNCGIELESGLRACPICGEPTEPQPKKRRALAPLALIAGFLLLCGCLFLGFRLAQVLPFGALTAKSAAQTAAPNVQTHVAFVFSGDEQVATRGFLHTDAQTLKAMDDTAFADFCTSVLRDDCDYFTMYLTADTGLVFSGTGLSPIYYGTLDENGNISVVQGTVFRDAQGHFSYVPAAVPTTAPTTTMATTAATTAPPTTSPVTVPALPTEPPATVSEPPTEVLPEAEAAAPQTDAAFIAAAPTTAAPTTTPPTTTPPTTTPPTAAPAPPSSGDTVYVTNSGTKYHRSGCSYLSHSKIAISLADAKAQGYTPCSRCF